VRSESVGWNADELCVAADPSPRLVRATFALTTSDRLLAAAR
jgi:hypothetical protein